jgi:hypothetical protein
VFILVLVACDFSDHWIYCEEHRGRSPQDLDSAMHSGRGGRDDETGCDLCIVKRQCDWLGFVVTIVLKTFVVLIFYVYDTVG